MKMGVSNMSTCEFGIHNPPLEKQNNCDKHGDFVDICYMRKTWQGCPICRQIKKDEAAESEKQYQLQVANIYLGKRISDSGIPDRFLNRTLENYQVDGDNPKQVKILKYCTDYAENFSDRKKTGLSFLMLGLPGTGKTHLSIGIAFEVMKNGHSSVFTTASRMLRAIKDTYHKGSEFSEMQVLATYETCDLLIIDEIGVQTGSDYEKNIIFDVINSRYENVRPTIILSNLSIDECKLYLGERVFDRMREGGGKAFLLDWPSFRK